MFTGRPVICTFQKYIVHRVSNAMLHKSLLVCKLQLLVFILARFLFFFVTLNLVILIVFPVVYDITKIPTNQPVLIHSEGDKVVILMECIFTV